MNPFLKFKQSADDQNPNSLSANLRAKRFEVFVNNLNPAGKKILDVGGTHVIWENSGFENDVTVLNLSIGEQSSKHLYVVADGCKLPFKDKSYDIIFSNSVIEHVGDFSKQKEFANEIMRVGKSYFIQTPYKHFPLEQHFLFPFFQYLPKSIQKLIGLRWKYSTVIIGGKTFVVDFINSLNLLSVKRAKVLFPNATIVKEKFWGFRKSLLVIGDW